MRSRLLKCFITFFLLISSPLSAYIRTTYMIAMRDGIQLATDVYLPETPGQWPAILIRTPYGKSSFLTPTEDFDAIVKLGYAIVAQDTRGQGDSQSVDSLFLDDGWGPRQDGYDTVE
jgi:putative CocE/NonD family hydrolase